MHLVLIKLVYTTHYQQHHHRSIASTYAAPSLCGLWILRYEPNTSAWSLHVAMSWRVSRQSNDLRLCRGVALTIQLVD